MGNHWEHMYIPIVGLREYLIVFSPIARHEHIKISSFFSSGLLLTMCVVMSFFYTVFFLTYKLDQLASSDDISHLKRREHDLRSFLSEVVLFYSMWHKMALEASREAMQNGYLVSFLGLAFSEVLYTVTVIEVYIKIWNERHEPSSFIFSPRTVPN
jgi:hypothetical protein